MRILITGGKGFFGSHLTAWLRGRGHEVVVTTRNPTGPGELPLKLGEGGARLPLSGFESIIHAAHDFDSAERSINGVRHLFEAARSADPRPRQLFVGSYSARPDAVSEYGRVKYELERLFLEAGDTVVRPGLIAGVGGMFGRTLRAVLASPIVPLIGGGYDQAPIVSISDAVRATAMLTEEGKGGAWNLFHPELPLMREVIAEIARCAGKRRLILPVPAEVALIALNAMTRLGIEFPIRADSIRSLQANRARIYDSDFARLGIEPMDLRRSVEESLREHARMHSGEQERESP